MMKTLILMRHGKSSWKDQNLIDHDRPLNKRGRKNAPRMGKLLSTENLVPDLIMTSSARRARDTAEAVADSCGYEFAIQQVPEFYQADLESFYEILGNLPDEVERAMVIGHNPDLEEFVEAVTDESVILPTAALVLIELPIDSWQEFTPTTEGHLMKVWLAREIG